MEVRISRKRNTPEQVAGKLRKVEVGLAVGQTVLEVWRMLGVTEQTYITAGTRRVAVSQILSLAQSANGSVE